MKFGKYLLRIVVLVSVLLTLSVQADAHTLWVNFTDYMPSAGGSGQMIVHRLGASFPCGQLCEGRRF